uniref:Putative secreted protein n=1 Tax=Ixodes ricinus TaxID=34613 RepID=A0A6B0U7C2_IXORI
MCGQQVQILVFFFSHFFFLGYIWCVHMSRDIPKLRASAGYETKRRRAMAERRERQCLGSSVQILASSSVGHPMWHALIT